MTEQSAAVLTDTNVLAYAYDPSDAAKQQRAQEVLRRLGGRRGALSTQVLGEYYVTLTRKLRPAVPAEIAVRSVERYFGVWTIFPLTADTVLEALHGVQRFQLPYWDSLIWATAKLNQVTLVLSEDFDDGAVLDGVRFRNPFAPAFDIALP